MISIARVDRLTAQEQAEIRALAAAVSNETGAPPLNDQTLLQLGETRPGLVHLLARDGERVTGYGQLDGESAEIAALSPDPLLVAAEQAGARVVWAHGRHSPVLAAAAGRGYRRVRELWQLRRAADEPVPDAAVPDDVVIRPFVPGRDEDAWLAVNAAAFATHAEQGAWTRHDLAAREAEEWFDPAGFLLAWRADELLGFHWTKLHPDGMGEVYVLGVAPAAQGARLGPALLAAGLRHLAGRGVGGVLLYVDGDNTPAIRLYERFGFTRHDLDVQLVHP